MTASTITAHSGVRDDSDINAVGTARRGFPNSSWIMGGSHFQADFQKTVGSVRGTSVCKGVPGKG